MYESGISIIPYPPLANEQFFRQLNTQIQPAIDDIKIIDNLKGKEVLNHIKLVMAKLNVNDWNPSDVKH